MTGSTTMLEENRGIWPWRGNRWEIWASSKNLGNLSTGHLEGARLGKDLGSGGRDEEREGHAVLGHREWGEERCGWVGGQDWCQQKVGRSFNGDHGLIYRFGDTNLECWCVHALRKRKIFCKNMFTQKLVFFRNCISLLLILQPMNNLLTHWPRERHW